MTLLAAIHEWPIDHVAAGAILPDGQMILDGAVDEVFELASLTKPLVAIATMVAVEDGTLDLDEPAGPPGSTLRHLLAHASGLDAASERILAEPGTRRIYSNAGFEQLGSMLVGRTGLDLPTVVHESVMAPLAMNSTSVAFSAATDGQGTARDLILLAGDLLAEQPRTIASTTRDQMTSVAFDGLPGVLPGFGSQDPNDWGLGFEIRGSKAPHWTPPEASPRTFGHFGRSGSLIWIDPENRAALIVLGDRPFGDWAPPLWRELGTSVLGA